ncbi:hypothetical protein MD484_g7113, partial [Candolleomyces efflorescens]
MAKDLPGSMIEGTKPLSPFGILHLLETQKARLFASTNQKYTALQTDLAVLKDNPGLLALILDTLIDLDIITQAHLDEATAERNWKVQPSDVDAERDVKKLESDSGEEVEPMIWDSELPVCNYAARVVK